jgi:hypothetical protein
VQAHSGQGIATLPKSSSRSKEDQREKQEQRPEDEKIDAYTTAVGRVQHRFIIDINKVRLNNIK